jgi:hypothetical protein
MILIIIVIVIKMIGLLCLDSLDLDEQHFEYFNFAGDD